MILIGIDDLRPDRLGVEGYYRNITPNLDKFSKNSFVFRNNIAQSSWTLPSFMSIMTSTYPYQHKIKNRLYIDENGNLSVSNLKKISPQIETLAEVLSKYGYKTAAFTGGSGLSKEFGFDSGFAEYRSEENFAGFEKTTDMASSWLDKNKNSKFFVFIHGYDCHGEFELPEEKRIYSLSMSKLYSTTPEYHAYIRDQLIENSSFVLSEEENDFRRNLYDDKVMNMDLIFGRFMQYLEKSNITENTLIVVFSDHGEGFLEHGTIDHGSNLYDELIKTALIIKIPGKNGALIDFQSRSIDIMPSILDILRIPKNYQPTNQMQGVSLLPLMFGYNLYLDAFSETDYRFMVSKKTLRTSEDWKIIVDDISGSNELFYLKKDPYEKNNIASENYDMMKIMKNKLKIYLGKSPEERQENCKINIKSTYLKEFECLESFEYYGKEFISFKKDDKYLKIEKLFITADAATKQISNDILEIKAIFSDSLSPYPGEITNRIVCDETFKPIFISENERNFSIMYSNERFNIGACSEDLLRYRHLIGWLYCKERNELYKIKYYDEMNTTIEKMKKIFLSFEC